ncbi:MAG: hypothetical protein V3W04_13840 [Gammaproteobacteria bacterium]
MIMTKTGEYLLLACLAAIIVVSVRVGLKYIQQPGIDKGQALSALQQSVCDCQGNRDCISRVYPVGDGQDIAIFFGEKVTGRFKRQMAAINDCAGLADKTTQISSLRQDVLITQMLARVGLDHKKGLFP